MARTILHCDLNCFFASVELLEHPELLQVPVAVCGDPASRHGIILAKNEAAKAFGVQTAETIWQAQRKCPNLALLPSHHEKYSHYSRLVGEIYGRYTDLVEPFGIDESWLDVTGTLHLFGCDGRGLADEIRRTVREELGLTLSVGVSFNKIFAKLGSDYKKPDATTVISPENWKSMVWPLPATDLLFVGKATAKVLTQFGVRTIGDLAKFDQDSLVTLLGKQGSQLYAYANGLECSPVAPADAPDVPKSIGNSNTFSRNLSGEEELRGGIAPLAENVAARLRRCGLKCTTVQIVIRDPLFHDLCRQKRLDAPSYLSRDITKAAMELLRASWSMSAPVRALSVTGQNLVPQDQAVEQIDFFGNPAADQRERLETLERTVDEIRSRFGPDILGYGTAWHGAADEAEKP